MRRLAFACFALLPWIWGCAGDSSSLMSVWNDGGPGGSLGGQGGQSTPSSGGAGGGGGATGGGTVSVQGGTRDLATAQCTAASSGGCAVDRLSLDCIQAQCGAPLVACYYSNGGSAAAGGKCQDYANCMLRCPCDRGQGACQDQCLADYGVANAECSMCLFALFTCASNNGCSLATTCASSTGGS